MQHNQRNRIFPLNLNVFTWINNAPWCPKKNMFTQDGLGISMTPSLSHDSLVCVNQEVRGCCFAKGWWADKTR